MHKDKQITFSRHALERLANRGATKDEVIRAIIEGESRPAKRGKTAFVKNFPFENRWKDRYYLMKQVMPIVAEEKSRYIVVTVYVFFIGEVKNENQI